MVTLRHGESVQRRHGSFPWKLIVVLAIVVMIAATAANFVGMQSGSGTSTEDNDQQQLGVVADPNQKAETNTTEGPTSSEGAKTSKGVALPGLPEGVVLNPRADAGFYSKPVPNAKGLGDVLASFIILAGEGKIDEAMDLAYVSPEYSSVYRDELRVLAEKLAPYEILWVEVESRILMGERGSTSTGITGLYVVYPTALVAWDADAETKGPPLNLLEEGKELYVIQASQGEGWKIVGIAPYDRHSPTGNLLK